ncbi:histone deacetylase family protein [Alphaproteobacteria bacterium]|nr:histone deacetylase family protein [Alphaproteobacteria bacterium]
MEEILVFTHNDCLLKDNGRNHPERKERLEVILQYLKKTNYKNILLKESNRASIKDIALVHPKQYIETLSSLIPLEGLVSVEKEPYADTLLCKNSWNAILHSCGSGISASDYLMQKNINKIFCAVRPPGHHAETIRANGFCFLNNIAISAKYLQKKYDVNKIAIIDFDVHHGNGTQEIFYNDKNIFYGSIHESPLFPGTGFEDEVGVGNIFNAPIKSGTSGDEFVKILDSKILDKVDKFKPEIILISAGFDAHKNDPLANINLECEHFYNATKKIVDLANIHSNGKVISFLEGGYNINYLEENIKQHFRGLLAEW